MGSVIEWIFGIALLGFCIIYPIAFLISLIEDHKRMKNDKSTRRSHRFGWTNNPWK